METRCIDPHAGFEGAELLQALAALEGARRKLDESFESLAAVAVEADVVEVIARPRGDGGAAEVERAGDGARLRLRREGRDELHDVGIAPFPLLADDGAKRRDVDASLAEGPKHGTHDRSLDGREIALHVDDDVVPAERVDDAQRLVDPVGAGAVVGTG